LFFRKIPVLAEANRRALGGLRWGFGAKTGAAGGRRAWFWKRGGSGLGGEGAEEKFAERGNGKTSKGLFAGRRGKEPGYERGGAKTMGSLRSEQGAKIIESAFGRQKSILEGPGPGTDKNRIREI